MVSEARQHRALVIALLASLLLWNLPFGGLAMYPFKLLATWLHELSHGLVMLLVGAGFDHMEIYRDTSGFAFSTSGTSQVGQAIIASAGYMGTALFGAIMLAFGRTRRGGQTALALIGLVMALSAALWVSNSFGIIAVAIGGTLFLVTALTVSAAVNRLLVSFVAAQACINSVLDIRTLFRANLVVDGQVMQASDAQNMAAATFGSAGMWAIIWLLWSFALFYAALRWGLTRDPASPDLPDPSTDTPPSESDCSDPHRSQA